MAVTMTSEALGKMPGEEYTGPEEDWLLAQGYARQDDYDGPGVSNTGPSDVDPDDDPTQSENREPAYTGFDDQHRPEPGAPAYDFDPGGVNDDVPGDFTVEPAELPLEGGAVVLTGSNFGRSTGVTFGGTEGTEFSVVNEKRIEVTAPAKEAGEYDVVVLNPAGDKTEVDAVTYAEAEGA